MEEPYGYQREGVDWSALGQRLGRHWLRIIGSVILAVAVAVIYLHFATYKYAARMRVAPVAGASSEGLSSKLGQLGGLAAVAGVALPDGGGNVSFKLYVEAVQSRDTAQRLLKDRELMRRIFVKEWNPAVRQWQRPTSAFSEFLQPIKSMLGVPTYDWRPPGAARLQEFIEKNVKVEQNSKSPVVSISIQHKDAKLAVDLLAGKVPDILVGP